MDFQQITLISCLGKVKPSDGNVECHSDPVSAWICFCWSFFTGTYADRSHAQWCPAQFIHPTTDSWLLQKALDWPWEICGLYLLSKEASHPLPREAQPGIVCCSYLQSCGHGKGRYLVWVSAPCALSSQSCRWLPVPIHRSRHQMYRTYCRLYLYMVQKEKQSFHNEVRNLLSVLTMPF